MTPNLQQCDEVITISLNVCQVTDNKSEPESSRNELCELYIIHQILSFQKNAMPEKYLKP